MAPNESGCLLLSGGAAEKDLGPTSEASFTVESCNSGAHKHLVIQVLTWLAQLPDPLPSGFCKEFYVCQLIFHLQPLTLQMADGLGLPPTLIRTQSTF